MSHGDEDAAFPATRERRPEGCPRLQQQPRAIIVIHEMYPTLGWPFQSPLEAWLFSWGRAVPLRRIDGVEAWTGLARWRYDAFQHRQGSRAYDPELLTIIKTTRCITSCPAAIVLVSGQGPASSEMLWRLPSTHTIRLALTLLGGPLLLLGPGGPTVCLYDSRLLEVGTR